MFVTSILLSVIIMRKTKRGLKPSPSSKGVGPKQKRQTRAKLPAQSVAELQGNHRDRMYCLSQNENSWYSSKSRRIHLLERNIVENSEVSRLRMESSDVNLILKNVPIR